MTDLGNNGTTGKLYRIIFFLNNSTRISIKTPYGIIEELETGELVRQGSVLGEVISANSLETVGKEAKYGLTGTMTGNLQLYPLCFVNDIAALYTTSRTKEQNSCRGVLRQEETTTPSRKKSVSD